MPQKLCVTLEGDFPESPHTFATALRGLIYESLRTENASLAHDLHDANQPKPLIISPLWHDERIPRTAYFHLSVLADWLLEPLLNGVEKRKNTLYLGRQAVRLASIQTVAETTWEDFFVPPYGEIAEFYISLLSPTAHHASGAYRKSVVLPSPELYFGSWFSRWNLCCELQMPESALEAVSAQVAVAYCSGATQPVSIDRKRPFIGFVGEVRFTILKPEELADNIKRCLLALARFSNFCGTGVETIRGMGQTVYHEKPFSGEYRIVAGRGG